MGSVGKLSDEQLKSFDSNGFLVIESFYSPGEVVEMRGRMEELLHDFDVASSASIFSTKNQQKLTDDYFFESAEKRKRLMMMEACGSLKSYLSIKLGMVCICTLHEIDPVFQKFSCSEKVSSVFRSLGYKRPVVVQSMYIFKQPGIGGEVVPHQDNSFLYTDPPSCTGLWLALQDATIVNGCLWVIPGSHTNGLVRRFIRDGNGVHFDNPSPSYDQEEFLPLEVEAGTLIVIHGDLIHQSFENRSPTSRHALSLHVVDSDGHKWAEDNWLQRKTAPEPLYIS